MKYSKVIVTMVIVLNVVFSAAVFWLIKETGVEPVALIAAWFTFTTGELWFLSGITKQKIKEDKTDGFNGNINTLN